MSKKTELPPLAPRELLNFIKSKMGKGYLLTKYHVTERTVDRWTADEMHVGEDGVRKNPIEKLEEILVDLMQRGHRVEAQAMVARWARLVGCEVMDCEQSRPDKEDMLAECLDDYPPLTQLHQAIEKKEPIKTVWHLAYVVIEEVRQTVGFYEKEKARQDKETRDENDHRD